jgi:hypothetical protein
MTKYPLEWGWDDQPGTSKASASPEWKPKLTLLGSNDDDTQIAAAGDLKCVGGDCFEGGTWGTTAAYNVESRNLCRSCAVKQLGIESLPGSEQNKILKNFELKGR